MSGELVGTPFAPAALASSAHAGIEVIRGLELEAWAARMEYAGKIARALAPTPFVPRSLRVYTRAEGSSRDEIDVGATTATVAAAVLTGTEIGLSPMGALRSIDIIEGTPALRAVALRALVLRAGHDLWVIESTSTRAIVSGIRLGTKHEQQSIWTIDRAKQAGLTGKPNWQRHPGAMLVARATGEVARLIAPDVLLGLPYIVEELEDGDQIDEPEIERPAAPGRRTAQRKRRAEPAPAALPDLPPIEPADPPPILELEEPAEQINPDAQNADRNTPIDEPAEETFYSPETSRLDDDQIRTVRRALIGFGMATTREQMEYIATVLHRPVARLADLVESEADTLLAEIADRLRDLDEQP